MIRFTVFPRLRILPHQKANPYIRDFVAALEQEKVSQVVNPPHKIVQPAASQTVGRCIYI